MIIHVNQIDLFFLDQGQGIPVVLMHGYPLDHTIWQSFFPLLVSHARVITPDLRGHGRTDTPDGVYTMRQIADDIAALLDALTIQKAIVIGHSMGGYAALAFASAYSERIMGLGMIASQAVADTPERQAIRRENAREVLEKGMATIAASMPEKLTTNSSLVPTLRNMILATKPKGAAGILVGMAERADMTSFLPQITVPTLIIAGEADALIPISRSTEMAGQLTNSKLLIIPGAGHMPMMEFPDKVGGALIELINDVKPKEISSGE
jgi:3-oxoadipate enol-lactonase